MLHRPCGYKGRGFSSQPKLGVKTRAMSLIGDNKEVTAALKESRFLETKDADPPLIYTAKK